MEKTFDLAILGFCGLGIILCALYFAPEKDMNKNSQSIEQKFDIGIDVLKKQRAIEEEKRKKTKEREEKKRLAQEEKDFVVLDHPLVHGLNSFLSEATIIFLFEFFIRETNNGSIGECFLDAVNYKVGENNTIGQKIGSIFALYFFTTVISLLLYFSIIPMAVSILLTFFSPRSYSEIVDRMLYNFSWFKKNPIRRTIEFIFFSLIACVGTHYFLQWIKFIDLAKLAKDYREEEERIRKEEEARLNEEVKEKLKMQNQNNNDQFNLKPNNIQPTYGVKDPKIDLSEGNPFEGDFDNNNDIHNNNMDNGGNNGNGDV